MALQRASTSATPSAVPAGPRIYNLFPLLAGPVPQWETHLPRIAAMGFDWIYVNPFHYPGFSGSLYAVKDYYRLHPALEVDGASADSLIGRFVEAAARRGVRVMMDLVVNHTAKDCPLVEGHPEWYAREADGRVKAPSAIDPANATQVTVWGDLAELDYGPRPERAGMLEYFSRVVRHYARLGVHGFRCDAAYKVPADAWRTFIAAAREVHPDTLFAAETLGCRLEEIAALHDAGFDYLFNSAKWWDFRAPWLLEQYEEHRRIAPSIAFPESHDTPRLATELAEAGLTEPARVRRAYEQRYLFAATFSAGVFMPMGYEYGFRRTLDVVETRPEDWEEPLFDLTGFIADANALKASTPAFGCEAPQRLVTPPDAPVVGLLREPDSNGAWALTLWNPDAQRAHTVPAAALHCPSAYTAAAAEWTREPDAPPASAGETLRLDPLGYRVFRGGAGCPTVSAMSEPHPTAAPAHSHVLHGELLTTTTSRPIVIQQVWPEIDGGRYPVKREVGDALEVTADIFAEGHGKLAAVVQYRARDEHTWREARMAHVDNDRWAGQVPLERNSRYLYTILAWRDEFESWVEEVEKKRQAGQEIDLELVEGRELVETATARATGDDRERLARILAEFDAVHGADDRANLLASGMVRQVVRRHPDRSAAVRYDRELEVVVDRVAARFAAWYEMFPRSQGTEPGRGATLAECERRLPEIRAMGFDVVYLVPVHPIGRSHRKGPNNTLGGGAADPGSPYAIGGPEGGHTAIHPELGTLDDFRRFVRACREHDMEVALDFAIQCSPDHPWIAEHPEWFTFRPDGTIKYAENPPKKYQDIVNVNFYGEHQDELWRALRDVLLFWVEQGVKIFRVDNPHTKPVPFWEWVIREVQERHPDVLFLSEAFTRPKMLAMLAKVGFTQSYTYFTWRNLKEELTEYVTELAQTELHEYLRPNFFTNTPDILPPFLQTGGRPAFRIRHVLAATLSSVYGIYNGFELCENVAVPGTEEYLNSEKYQYKVWDWDRPGNIKAEIGAVNRIRRENPALHEFENVRFHPASSEHVLFYGKMTFDRSNVVFVAVNLDPFDAHETTLEFPLAAMGIPPHETFEVEELLTGEKHFWRGARQRLRLDPTTNPAAIFRVTPWIGVDYREPCF